MAEVFLNPVFTSLSGRVGDIVFYGYGGKTYFRSYVKPCNPDTPSQKRNRGLFAEAMKAWQKLSRFDKDSYRHRAGRIFFFKDRRFVPGNAFEYLHPFSHAFAVVCFH